MEFIVGILELIIRGGTEVGKNKKYSKWIRYPLLFLVGIVYFGLIALFILGGFIVLEDGLWRAMFIWIVGLAFVVGTIWGTIWDFRTRDKKKNTGFIPAIEEGAKTEEDMDKGHFLMHHSKHFMWLEVKGMLFFGGMIILVLVYFLIDSDDPVRRILLIMCLLLAPFFLWFTHSFLHSTVWRVEVEGTNIYYRNWYGRIKTFRFEDIKRIDIKEAYVSKKYVLYSEKGKLLAVESICHGFDLFEERLKEENIIL